MIDQNLFSELAERLFNKLPGNQNISSVKEDITKTFQTVLEQSFSKLDLVTREQFDIQCKVLADTKAELEELHSKFSRLEGAKGGF